ncbi:unnamed protein product, partial [Urochloa humidicola]
MSKFLVSCGNCGLLLMDMEEIQEHAVKFKGIHSDLLLSLDGFRTFSCCNCESFFRHESEIIFHKDEKSHHHFVDILKLQELGEAQSSYTTPLKSRINTRSGARTVKKAPKAKELQTLSAIPFSLSDDECDNVFNMLPDSSTLADAGEQPSEEHAILYKVRSLNNIQLRSGQIEALKKIFVIAEGVSRVEAKRKVQNAVASWDEAKKTFKLVGKKRKAEGDSSVFVESLQQLCLKRSKPYDCASDKAERMYKLMNVILHILEHDIVLRIRSLYYLYPHLHVLRMDSSGKPISSDRQIAIINETVSDICLYLEITRESLNLFASPQGLIAGPVLLFSDGKLWVNCNLGGPSGCLIPSESVFINRIDETDRIPFVLVVEKETVFHYLSDHGFVEKHNCILVTGKGQADLATRILLRKMRDHFKGMPF